MNVKEIVVIWLKRHKFDGLYSEDCGCSIDDLFLCGGQGMFENCKPGVKTDKNNPDFIGPREENMH